MEWEETNPPGQGRDEHCKQTSSMGQNPREKNKYDEGSAGGLDL